MTNIQIESFLMLCKYMNISAASEALFITQPALSRTIRSLEKELGYQLFVRKQGTRHMSLSPEGEEFYTIASGMKRLYTQAKEIHSKSLHRSFHIAASPSLFRMFLPEACIRFRKEHPDVELAVDMLHSNASFQQVRTGRIDMALVCENYIDPAVRSVPLFREDIVLICSRGMFPDGPVHPSCLDRSKAVIIKWNPEYRYWFEHWFGKDFEVPQLHLMSANSEFFRYLSDFWAILPSFFASQVVDDADVEFHQLTGTVPSRFCYCIYPPDSKQDLQQEIVRILRSSIPDTPTIHPM